MNTLTKNLVLLGIVLTTISASSYARDGRGGGGYRMDRDSGLEERGYGRDRVYDNRNRNEYRHNDYRRYDGRGYYRGLPVYYNGGYDGGVEYIPAPDAESYNDITNPQPGDQSNTSNFQNSNFDSQIWDMGN